MSHLSFCLFSGSKSIANRVLLLAALRAALGGKAAVLEHLPCCSDCSAMALALQQLAIADITLTPGKGPPVSVSSFFSLSSSHLAPCPFPSAYSTGWVFWSRSEGLMPGRACCWCVGDTQQTFTATIKSRHKRPDEPLSAPLADVRNICSNSCSIATEGTAPRERHAQSPLWLPSSIFACYHYSLQLLLCFYLSLPYIHPIVDVSGFWLFVYLSASLLLPFVLSHPFIIFSREDAYLFGAEAAVPPAASSFPSACTCY